MQAIRITAELTPEAEGGYSVYCPEFDIFTQGDTEQECLESLREAAYLHLEEMSNSQAVRRFLRWEIEVRPVA